MLTLVNVIWGARCGETARRVLLGETGSRGHAYSVRRRRESAYDRKAPPGLPSSRLVSTNPFDLWVNVWRKKWAHGEVVVIRYADDIILGFQHQADADRFLENLQERLGMFGLELHRTTAALCRFQKPIGVLATKEDAAAEMEQRRTNPRARHQTSVFYSDRGWMSRRKSAPPA
jgi:hypothetical protein